LLVNGTFLVDCPGETKETMRETLELAKGLNPDLAQFFPVMVYPGTEMYNDYKRKGYIISENFRDWNEQGLLFATSTHILQSIASSSISHGRSQDIQIR